MLADTRASAELAALISRDCVVGCALPNEPGQGRERVQGP